MRALHTSDWHLGQSFFGESRLAEHRDRPCDRCKSVQTLPMSLDGLEGDDTTRMAQFFKGGPLYCAKCFPEVPPCDDCGWHVPLENIAEHHRSLHSH